MLDRRAILTAPSASRTYSTIMLLHENTLTRGQMDDGFSPLFGLVGGHDGASGLW